MIPLHRVTLLAAAAGVVLSAASMARAQEAISPEPTAPEATSPEPTDVAPPIPDDPVSEVQEAQAAGVVFAKIKAPSILELKVSAKDAKDLSCDSRMAVLLDNPAAREVLKRHIPDVVSDHRISMARGMTLKQVASHSKGGITAEQLAEIDQDLASATHR